MNPNSSARGVSPRWINVIAATWLFFSAFLWEHTTQQFNNAWLVGAAATIAAVAAMRADKLRYVNIVLSLWLLISAWALPTATEATFWNSLLVSLVMFIAALAPQTPIVRSTHEPPSQRPISARH